jgi:hypothetical protein
MKPNPLASLKNLTVPVMLLFKNYLANVSLIFVSTYILTIFILKAIDCQLFSK